MDEFILSKQDEYKKDNQSYFNKVAGRMSKSKIISKVYQK